MPLRSLVLLSLLILSLASWATAQAPGFRIGAVLSQTGSEREGGQAQARALALPQFSDQGLQLLLADDTSVPERALAEVRRLVEEDEVVALICCSSEAATRAIRDYVNEVGVLTLSLSSLPAGEPGTWLFSVQADARRRLQSAILTQTSRNLTRFGLMTLEGAYGDEVRSLLDLLIGPGSSAQLVVDQRYPPNAQALTPEALWVATRLPDTVLLWGLGPDTLRGYQALRARGYQGDVVINPAVLASGTGVSAAQLEGALVPVTPAAVAASLGPEHLTYGLTQRYVAQLAPFYGGGRVPSAGAFAYDALLLLNEALEQAYTYGVDLSDPAVVRGVLRDAFVGMGTVAGASGSFDYRDGDHVGLLPTSLVLARLRNGQLEYAE